MVEHLLLLLLAAPGLAVLKPTMVVELAQGKVRGLETQRGDYRKFLGIPYATVVGRFQDPGPAPQWDSTLNATENKVICAQYSRKLRSPVGSEDCLTLSVYAPGQVSAKRQLPVMVFLHGGDFSSGSASELEYNPETLVKKNVIVVVPNYRLGPFGFLCLKVKGASGNAGLKDIFAALQWTSSNIKSFGGDPELMTLFGDTEGASLVSYLILSGKAHGGLFKRAIMQSGTAFSSKAFSYNPIRTASLTAARLGFRTKNPLELMKIFANASTSDLVMASEVKDLSPLSEQIFRPCIEKFLPGESAILTNQPKDLSHEAMEKFTAIVGYDKNAASKYANDLDDAKLDDINNKFEDYLPANFGTLTFKQRLSAAQEIKDFYFGSTPNDKTFKNNLTEYLTDILYAYPLIQFTDYMIQNNLAVYNYYFQYEPKYMPSMYGKKEMPRSSLLRYVFQSLLSWPTPKSKKDVLMMDRVTTMWSNYAKTGDPTSLPLSQSSFKWRSNSRAGLRYLTLDDDLRMTSPPAPRQTDFWTYIYNKYGVM